LAIKVVFRLLISAISNDLEWPLMVTSGFQLYMSLAVDNIMIITAVHITRLNCVVHRETAGHLRNGWVDSDGWASLTYWQSLQTSAIWFRVRYKPPVRCGPLPPHYGRTSQLTLGRHNLISGHNSRHCYIVNDINLHLQAWTLLLGPIIIIII